MASPNPNPNPPPNQGDAPPQYTGHPLFDFVQSMQPGTGAGVDHRGPQFPGFPWADFVVTDAAGECPRRAGRCRRGRRWAAMNNPGPGTGEDSQHEHGAQAQENEKDDSPDTMRDVDDPPEVYPRPGHGPGHQHRRRGPHPFWGPGPPGHGPHSHGPHHAPPHPPPPFPFDARTIHSFIQPWAQAARTWGEQIRRAATEASAGNANVNVSDVADDTFEPPIDIFSTERAFVLHVAVPGANKEDVGVNWDGEKGELRIAGVVYRPGDEEFLRTMVSSERKAGMFERVVKIPPQGSEKEEVDGLAISAKLEEGVLIVTVPKLEKEWTEIRKVDIE